MRFQISIIYVTKRPLKSHSRCFSWCHSVSWPPRQLRMFNFLIYLDFEDLIKIVWISYASIAGPKGLCRCALVLHVICMYTLFNINKIVVVKLFFFISSFSWQPFLQVICLKMFLVPFLEMMYLKMLLVPFLEMVPQDVTCAVPWDVPPDHHISCCIKTLWACIQDWHRSPLLHFEGHVRDLFPYVTQICIQMFKKSLKIFSWCYSQCHGLLDNCTILVS